MNNLRRTGKTVLKNEVEKTPPKIAEKTDLKFVSEKNAFEKRPGKTLLKFCRKNGFKKTIRKNGFKNHGIKNAFRIWEKNESEKRF